MVSHHWSMMMSYFHLIGWSHHGLVMAGFEYTLTGGQEFILPLAHLVWGSSLIVCQLAQVLLSCINVDIIPRNTRIYTTRLRTSSHAYPIETLRYCKPKVEPQDRKCKICPSDRTGDENHYLFDCSNDRLRPIRDNFIQIITQIVPTFKDFNQEHIIQYCLLLHDIRTIARTANYIKEIHIAFKEETEERKKRKKERNSFI